MKTLYKFLLVVLMALPLWGQAQCDLPQAFTGNTGSNMTVMLTKPFLNSLNALDRAAYIVAKDPNGLIVGSEPVGLVTQTTIAVWGDDASTGEVDGAAPNAAISFQLVDGESLYDVQMPIPVSFVANSFVAQPSAGALALNCAPAVSGCTDASAVNYNSEATEDDGSCYVYCSDEWRPKYTGNTGSNMTLMLTQSFISSLGIEDDGAYLIATRSDGLLVGSSDVSTEKSSLALWGNDSYTDVIDGAFDGDTIDINLIIGNSVYDLNHSVVYVGNSIAAIINEVTPSLICVVDGSQGCTDANACNYNAEAEIDNGSCTYAETYYDCSGDCLNDADGDGICDELEVLGCTNSSACNFSSNATEDDASCNISELNYDCAGACLNDTDADGVCNELEVPGCTSVWADNLNTLATDDDGSCYRNGCTLAWADNYEALATNNDGSCSKDGCTSSWADNYDAQATVDDGSCYKDGCTSDWADNYDAQATDDDGSCSRLGCVSNWADNYDAQATDDDDSCSRLGCVSNWADNFDPLATDDDSSCIRNGCTDSTADNFDSLATDDDGSCLYSGCTINTACNYNTTANVNDGSCEFPQTYYDCNDQCLNDTDSDGVCDELEVLGCQQANANNYNPLATDSGACIYYGCMEVAADNYNANANTSDGSCYYLGCMSQDALNYDASATRNDESICVYNVANFGCDIPEPYSGLITGSNMNVLFTSDFTSQITTTSNDAYLVGMTDADRTVGSAPIQQGVVTSITLWGDDVQTDPIDGAVSWEGIRLFVVDGNDLHRITLKDPLNYSENKTLILHEFTELTTLCMQGYYTQLPIYGCTDPLANNYIQPTGDASVDVNTEDGTCLYDESSNCVFPGVYPGAITGNNMNILFTENFMGSLPNLQEGAYIVAANQENTSFGSVAVFGTSIISLTLWGDDTGTQELDGATEGASYDLYLVNGRNLYDISPYQANTYQNNGMLVYKDAASVKSLCANGKVVYMEACTDALAINYVPAATTDDGSCIYEGCTYDVFYEYTEEVSVDNGACENLIVYGCTDSLYVEYHPLATENDSSCVYSVERISDLEATEIAHEELLLENSEMSRRLNPIPLDLFKGWNIIGYNLNYPQNTAACFDGISDRITLAKDNNGMMYWPEFGWNGIGNLVPGRGYQIYMSGEVDDFSFVDLGGMRVEMHERTPQWAQDLAPVHPNDVRTLVRVVNMLGQEVSVETQERHTPLLYLYNDGTVEKKLKK